MSLLSRELGVLYKLKEFGYWYYISWNEKWHAWIKWTIFHFSQQVAFILYTTWSLSLLTLFSKWYIVIENKHTMQCWWMLFEMLFNNNRLIMDWNPIYLLFFKSCINIRYKNPKIKNGFEYHITQHRLQK